MIQRKLIFILLSLFVCLTTNAKEVIDEVVWVVGDEAILRSEVEEYTQQLEMSQDKGEFEGKDLFCLVPEQIAIQKLLLDQAALDSIEVNTDAVKAQVEQRIDYFISGLGSAQKVEEYFGKKMPAIRSELQETLGEQMLSEMARQKIVEDVAVTPADVRAFYNDIPQDSLPTVPMQYEIQMISLNPIIPKEEIERVKTALQDLKKRAEDGEMEFSSLARLYSEDGSATQGGELGFMGRGQLVPEFASVAFALQKPGDISRVVESEFGFHIIQLIERRGDRINTRHILMRPEISLTSKQLAMERLDSISGDIANKKYTFEQAALLFSQDKNTRMNEGIMSNAKTGNSRFKVADIPAGIYAAIDTLEVGGMSAPITIANEQGRDMLAVVKLKSKLEEHKLNPADDFQDLKEYALNKKKAEKFQDWISQKLKDTYVQIGKGWRDCEFTHKGWVK
jgi:peptidyl-prolyl cis-trans isomerase SurA